MLLRIRNRKSRKRPLPTGKRYFPSKALAAVMTTAEYAALFCKMNHLKA